MTKITIGDVLMYSWFATSLGIPSLTEKYVDKLGDSVGLKCEGASGVIIEKDPTKNYNIERKKYFTDDLISGNMIQLSYILGPLSIPLCKIITIALHKSST